jgi:hypothetical protein
MEGVRWEEKPQKGEKKMVKADFYTNKESLKKNLGWHVDASP